MDVRYTFGPGGIRRGLIWQSGTGIRPVPPVPPVPPRPEPDPYSYNTVKMSEVDSLCLLTTASYCSDITKENSYFIPSWLSFKTSEEYIKSPSQKDLAVSFYRNITTSANEKVKAILKIYKKKEGGLYTNFRSDFSGLGMIACPSVNGRLNLNETLKGRLADVYRNILIPELESIMFSLIYKRVDSFSENLVGLDDSVYVVYDGQYLDEYINREYSNTRFAIDLIRTVAGDYLNNLNVKIPVDFVRPENLNDFTSIANRQYGYRGLKGYNFGTTPNFGDKFISSYSMSGVAAGVGYSTATFSLSSDAGHVDNDSISIGLSIMSSKIVNSQNVNGINYKCYAGYVPSKFRPFDNHSLNEVFL